LLFGELPFRASEPFVRFRRRDRHLERPRRGVAHILRREPDHPAGDVKRVLPRGEHPRKPVEGGVRVRSPQALVERGDQVVMLLPVLVVEEPFFPQRLLRRSQVDRGESLVLRDRDRGLEGVQRHPGVAVRHRDDVTQRVGGEERLRLPEPAHRIRQGAGDDPLQMGGKEGRKDQHAAAGQQRVADLEP